MNLKNLNPYEWQVIATAIFILLFEAYHIGFRIKKIIYDDYWVYRKPWDCRFCMFFWIGSISGIYFIFIDKPSSLVYFLAINIITAKIYDYAFTKTK